MVRSKWVKTAENGLDIIWNKYEFQITLNDAKNMLKPNIV